MDRKSVAAGLSVGLLLAGALFGCASDHSTGGEGGDDSSMTERHSRGWKWAEQRKVRSDAQCEQLEDPQMKAGCEAYVAFVSTQIMTSP